MVVAAAFALSTASTAAPARDRLTEANLALERGEGIAAEVAVQEALQAGASRSEVAALIGEAELLQGDLADARRWLAGGEFSAATRERGYHALARLEMTEGNLAAAAAAFDRALETGAGSARLWADIGRLRYSAGQHRPALDAAARAVATDPDDPRALEFQAQLTRDSKGVLAALPLFERALESAPDDLGLLGEYAATLGEAGRHRDMLDVARRMVELDPRHPRAYYLQAVLAARGGLDDLARRLLARTGGSYDAQPASQLLAGVLELRSGNAGLAIERFAELARRQSDNGVARILLGRALLAHGEAGEVVARWAPAADRADASPYLLTLVGRALEQLGRRQDAARYLDRAAAARSAPVGVLAADPRGAAATGLGAEVSQIRLMLVEGRTGEAVNRVRALRARFPDSIDIDILSGDVSLLAGNPEAALEAFRRAAAVRCNFAVVERMVEAHRALGRHDGASDVLAGYLAQNPRSAAAAAMLGRMESERGDWRRARLLLTYANLLRPDDARLLADLAKAQLASGETEAAEQTARASHRLHRASRPVAATLAKVLAASDGAGEEARAPLAKAPDADSNER